MMNKTYEIKVTRQEFDNMEDERPIMVLRNRLMELVKADGQDPDMYDSKFQDEEDQIRMTAHFNERRFKNS